MAKTKVPAAVREYMAKMGRRGGKASGKSLTPEQRSERASRAAKARWKTKKKK